MINFKTDSLAKVQKTSVKTLCALAFRRSWRKFALMEEKPKYALYIHGLGSGAKSGTSTAFKRYFPEYEWLCPEVNEDIWKSIAKIEEWIEVFRPQLIAGTSMGGFLTAYAAIPEGLSTIKIVCNATISIEHTLRKVGYGKHTFFCEREDGRTEYVIDETVVRKFTAFKQERSIAPAQINIGVYSKDDELVGQVESRKNAKLLEEAGFTIYWSDKFGHRMNENVAKKIPAWLKEQQNNCPPGR